MSTNTINIEETILFEDDDLIVCYKPSGLSVQTARFGEMDLECWLKNYLAAGKSGKMPPYLAVIHRLDQPVEGLLVFGKTPHAAKELNRQNTSGLMNKEYTAVLLGKPEPAVGKLEHYLLKDGRTNTSKAVEKGIKGSKYAALEYQLVNTGNGKSLVSVHLLTGRHHQIRVQFAAAGWPLLGDRKYGDSNCEGTATSFIALCANHLEFFHPKIKKKMEFAIKPKGEGFIL